MENNSSTTSETTVSQKLTRPRAINIYASLAVSLIVVAAITLLTFFAYFVSTAFDQGSSYSYSAFASSVPFAYLVAVGSVFLSVPLLINVRYGWRTVVATFLAQSLLIFVILSTLTLIFPSQDTTTPIRPLGGIDNLNLAR